MLQLKHLMLEISLAQVTPYATQLVWEDTWGDGEKWECQFMADSQPISMYMTSWTTSRYSDSGEWSFSYFVRTEDGSGWTVNTVGSGAKGTLNILRLLKTLGEAIRDFADTHAGVDVIDVTGGDSAAAKELQKTRIYTDLLRTNPDLAAFKVVQGATKLYLVRKNLQQPKPDASGIDTPNDPNM